MNQNLKNIIIAIIVGIIVTILTFWAIGGFQKNSFSAGQINADTRRGSSNTYTQTIASTTASLALEDTAGCLGLEIQNSGSNNVRVKLQATSTGLSATAGMKLAAGQGYTPEFIWGGGVWVITDTGTSTVEIQCTKAQ